MVSQGAGIMVSVKDQPWNHRDMDFCGIKLFVTMIVSLTYYFSGRWKKSAIKRTPVTAVYGLNFIKHGTVHGNRIMFDLKRVQRINLESLQMIPPSTTMVCPVM